MPICPPQIPGRVALNSTRGFETGNRPIMLCCKVRNLRNNAELFTLRFSANMSLICDKGVKTQNFTFLSYWYRKKRLQMDF